MKRFIALILAVTMLSAVLCACGNVSDAGETTTKRDEPALVVPTGDLLADYAAQNVTGKAPDEKFTEKMLDFAAELFSRTTSDDGKSSLISPLSVIIALSMTANGAEGNTKAQFEDVFGLSIEDMNEYLYYFANKLTSNKEATLKIANSIWLANNVPFEPNPTFLQKDADYYDASIYEKDFSKSATVDEINAWVKYHTDEMISKIIDELDPLSVMVLMNALVFDAKWASSYDPYSVQKGRIFRAYDGSEDECEMLTADEKAAYYESEDAVGFSKKYAGDISFTAILPSEDVDVFEYARSLTGEKLREIFKTKKIVSNVHSEIPKFTYEYGIEMVEALCDMGITDAFDGLTADFSGMEANGESRLYIGNVTHKTFIKLSEEGTRAAAVTEIGMKATSVEKPMTDRAVVVLDRPFVYMITDDATGLPLFIGVVTEISK